MWPLQIRGFVDREHWAYLFPLGWAPKVGMEHWGLLGLRDLWTIGVCDPYSCSRSGISTIVTHRVCVILVHYDNSGIPPYLGLAKYNPVGIIPTSRACWDCPSLSGQRVDEAWGVLSLPLVSRVSHPSLDYDAGVLPHESWGSFLGRSIRKRMDVILTSYSKWYLAHWLHNGMVVILTW